MHIPVCVAWCGVSPYVLNGQAKFSAGLAESAERLEYAYIGLTPFTHPHELSKRLDALWRYDQYIANAEQHADLQNFWRDMKEQETKNVQRLKALVSEHCRKECF